MNSKLLFYIFIKYGKVVLSRYSQLTTPPIKYADPSRIKRQQFDIVLSTSKSNIDWLIKTSGRNEFGYRYNFPDYKFYFGKEGWNKHGVFSYIPLYKEAIWSIEVIEKYKDFIVWPLLLEYGDFTFEEEILIKYEKYILWKDYSFGIGRFIPFVNNGVKTNKGTTLSNFSNIGNLSCDFVKTHVKEMDLKGLCTTGCFDVTKELMQLLYDNCAERLCGWLSINERIKIPSEILLYLAKELQCEDWQNLLKKVDFTPEVLLELYQCDKRCLEKLWELKFEHRKDIIFLIERNNSLKHIIEPEIIKKLWQGSNAVKFRLKWDSDESDFINLPYTYDFSIDLIKKEYEIFNGQCFEFFSHNHRTSDTNYHRYKRITPWNVMSNQESVLLTYDLCKYLMSIEVMVGGSYTLEDGTYRTDDIPDHLENGLKLFQFRDVLNDEELIKISYDEDIIEFLFQNAELPKWGRDYYVTAKIIDKLILKFFEDFSFEKFKELYESKYQ